MQSDSIIKRMIITLLQASALWLSTCRAFMETSPNEMWSSMEGGLSLYVPPHHQEVSCLLLAHQWSKVQRRCWPNRLRGPGVLNPEWNGVWRVMEPGTVVKLHSRGKLERFSWWSSGWESKYQCRAHGLDPWSGKIPHASEQLSPCTTATEACLPRTQAPQQEKPLQWKPIHCDKSVVPTPHN